MSCGATYAELAERGYEVFVNAHKVTLSIAQKVS